MYQYKAEAGAQSVRGFAPQAEGWAFESHPRQTQIFNTCSDISTANVSAKGVSVTYPRRWPYKHMSRVSIVTLMKPHCLMEIIWEYKSKLQALYWFRFSLQINEKFSIGNPKTSNNRIYYKSGEIIIKNRSKHDLSSILNSNNLG